MKLSIPSSFLKGERRETQQRKRRHAPQGGTLALQNEYLERNRYYERKGKKSGRKLRIILPHTRCL